MPYTLQADIRALCFINRLVASYELYHDENVDHVIDFKTIKNKVRVASLARADPEEAKPIHEKANASQSENLKCVKNIHANPKVDLLYRLVH